MKSETNNQKTFSSFAIPLFRRKTVDANKNHPAKKEKSFVINGQKTRAIESWIEINGTNSTVESNTSQIFCPVGFQ